MKHSYFFLLGNHDFEVAPDYLSSVLRVKDLKRAYYDFKGGGYRFIVLNGNDISLFANTKDDPKYKLTVEKLEQLKAADAPNAQSWNGGMSEIDLRGSSKRWIGLRLRARGSSSSATTRSIQRTNTTCGTISVSSISSPDLTI